MTIPFRQLFTSRFMPEGTHEQMQWFNELCLKTTTGDIAAELLEARGNVDVSELLADVRTPTLVVHARNEQVSPIEEGRLIAAGIRDAQFVELDSRNHILLEHEPAWQRFVKSSSSSWQKAHRRAATRCSRHCPRASVRFWR